jgi:hypothetical protein
VESRARAAAVGLARAVGFTPPRLTRPGRRPERVRAAPSLAPRSLSAGNPGSPHPGRRHADRPPSAARAATAVAVRWSPFARPSRSGSSAAGLADREISNGNRARTRGHRGGHQPTCWASGGMPVLHNHAVSSWLRGEGCPQRDSKPPGNEHGPGDSTGIARPRTIRRVLSGRAGQRARDEAEGGRRARPVLAARTSSPSASCLSAQRPRNGFSTRTPS